MKLPKLSPAKRQTSLVSSISTMWILTGVILLIVGIWAVMLYFVLEPYRGAIEANADTNPILQRVITFIGMLLGGGAACTAFAVFTIYVGASFRKFKTWALGAVNVLAYIMLILVGAASVFWVKIWQFSLDFTPAGSGSDVWSYVGLFAGLCAMLFYIVIMIYFIRALRMKQFRDAYKNKLPF